MNKLRNTEEKIRNEWTILQRDWDTVAALWNDPNRQQFEREFWESYEETIRPILKAIDQLGQVIDQAKQQVK